MEKPSSNINDGLGPLLVGDRPLPHNLKAEKAVLGCLLTDPDTLKEAIIRLRIPNAFYSAANQTIFDKIIEMAEPTASEKKTAIDLITVSQALKNANKLHLVGGDSYLAELMNIIPTTANVENYVRIVHEYAVLRKLIQTSSDIVQKCFDSEVQINELIDNVQQEVSQIANFQSGKDASPIRDFMTGAIKVILETNENVEIGLSTGFKDLDDMMNGMKGGDMVVLAARPSIGKTTIAMNIAANVALRSKKPVGVFSLEMNSQSLALRILCSEAKINLREIKTGVPISGARLNEITGAASRLNNAPLYIDDTGQLDIIQLRAKARRMKDKYDIQFIVIDYLQLMKGSNMKYNSNREQEVASISGGIKALAKELNIPILILAQLNRQAESGERPKLSHLRESGAIEQDADVVMILHRERNKQFEGDQVEMNKHGIDCELIIAKHRNGETGLVPLIFFPSYTLFQNKSRIAEEDVPQI